MEKLTTIQAIKKFFDDSPKPLTMQELKALTAEDRKQLGELCAKALGVEIAPTA